MRSPPRPAQPPMSARVPCEATGVARAPRRATHAAGCACAMRGRRAAQRRPPRAVPRSRSHPAQRTSRARSSPRSPTHRGVPAAPGPVAPPPSRSPDDFERRGPQPPAPALFRDLFLAGDGADPRDAVVREARAATPQTPHRSGAGQERLSSRCPPGPASSRASASGLASRMVRCFRFLALGRGRRETRTIAAANPCTDELPNTAEHLWAEMRRGR